jgi:hypothetical protein
LAGPTSRDSVNAARLQHRSEEHVAPGRRGGRDTGMSEGEDWGKAFTGLLIVLVGSFVLLDCSFGTTGSSPGLVRAHEHIPAHYVPVTSCVERSGCTTSMQYVPDVWRLVVSAEQDYVDVEVRRKLFYDVADGQPVLVHYRRGKITQYWYLRRVEPAQPAKPEREW